jgi:hypothetical protein
MRTVMIASAGVIVLIAITAALADRGEVAILKSRSGNQFWIGTRLWVVEVDGAIYVRGPNHSGWVERVRADPEVWLTRGEATAQYHAATSADAGSLATVERAIAEKYGVTERWLDRLFDGSDPIAVRLESNGAPAGSSP